MPHLNEEKQVILTLERDSEKHRFTVIASIKNERDETLSQQRGYLPDCPDLFEQFDIWCYELHSFAGFIERQSESVTVDSDLSIEDLLDEEEKTIEELQKQYEATEKKWIKLFNQWLELTDFNKILIELNNKIPNSVEQQVRVIIQTDCPEIKILPWERWNWLTDNRRGRIILRPLAYQRISTKQPNQLKVQIILGRSNDSRNKQELQRLKDYFQKFDILPPLKNPNRDQVFDCIQNQKFHILYFGGHGKTEENIGKIYINESEYLEINNLVFPLKEAIRKGLKLAIFKCCQGIGLENNLTANKIYIPNLIVTRDIIHDEAAKKFIDNCLDSFVRDKNSLHIAFDNARQNLRKSQYPGSSLMPLLFQISEKPQYLDDWFYGSTPPTFTQSLSSDLVVEDAAAIALHENISPKLRRPVVKKLGRIAIVSFVVTVLVMGVRSLGFLQGIELWTYDKMMYWRSPQKQKEPRILVVTIDKQDIDYQEKEEKWTGKSSLKDRALYELLEKLQPFKPITIGSDIYHTQNFDRNFLSFFQSQDNLYFICKKYSNKHNQESLGQAPPLEINSNYWGFNDVYPDYFFDNVVRRHVLTQKVYVKDPCETEYSFSFSIALHYLHNKHHIDYDFEEGKSNVRINFLQGNLMKGHLYSLRQGSSGYQKFHDGGTQILVDYTSYQDSFEDRFYHIALKDILENNIPQDIFNILDKKSLIILIGNIEPDIGKDIHHIPNAKVFGVFLQAQIISQILGITLDGKDSLKWWPRWFEFLVIWGLSLIIVSLRLWVNKKINFYGILVFFISLVVLPIVSIFLFTQISIWFSFIPVTLALILSYYSVGLQQNLKTNILYQQENHNAIIEFHNDL